MNWRTQIRSIIILLLCPSFCFGGVLIESWEQSLGTKTFKKTYTDDSSKSSRVEVFDKNKKLMSIAIVNAKGTYSCVREIKTCTTFDTPNKNKKRKQNKSLSIFNQLGSTSQKSKTKNETTAFKIKVNVTKKYKSIAGQKCRVVKMVYGNSRKSNSTDEVMKQSLCFMEKPMTSSSLRQCKKALRLLDAKHQLFEVNVGQHYMCKLSHILSMVTVAPSLFPKISRAERKMMKNMLSWGQKPSKKSKEEMKELDQLYSGKPQKTIFRATRFKKRKIPARYFSPPKGYKINRINL